MGWENEIILKGASHITRMAAMRIDGEKLKKTYFSETEG